MTAPDERARCHLRAIHSGLSKTAVQLWFNWNVRLGEVINSTTQYGAVTAQDDEELLSQWDNLIASCSDQWAQLVGVSALTTAGMGPDEDGSDDEVDSDDGHNDEAEEALE